MMGDGDGGRGRGRGRGSFGVPMKMYQLIFVIKFNDKKLGLYDAVYMGYG